MNEKQKIEFLLDLLKTEKFEMDLARAHALVTSYRWLLEQFEKIDKED
jgi:hypothetical protein